MSPELWASFGHEPGSLLHCTDPLHVAKHKSWGLGASVQGIPLPFQRDPRIIQESCQPVCPRALAATSVPTLPPPHSCWDELSPQRTWLLCYPLVALHSRSPGGFARSKRPNMMCPVSLSRILSHLLPHALPSRSPPNTHDASHLHAAAHAVPLCLCGTPPTSTDSTAIQP